MSGNKIVAALAVATAAGVLCAVSAAAEPHDNNRERGGFVIPGSTDGVNAAYHPEYFGSLPNRACFERFKTYDAASETYLGKDAHRHPCRL